ncbi:glucosamine--fructose-6-phosphate aminotransferase [Leifsonia xyli subsp. cynodontis DSM 46306]|uniref:Uncharacterized protein n=1 Tax=Leifsonia xyli subsp. cynodontis DSM 46306 TaxID=1389489 RepID=U3PE46_LEIXC|nr:hypothetical protein [Leifsonia xyli]AGW41838.1 glucosamine--fructose-6-phosphate aminotransferase [Leifsonia xyli subsp. cynodontis DSM 46306]
MPAREKLLDAAGVHSGFFEAALVPRRLENGMFVVTVYIDGWEVGAVLPTSTTDAEVVRAATSSRVNIGRVFLKRDWSSDARAVLRLGRPGR